MQANSPLSASDGHLVLRNISKHFATKEGDLHVLDNINLSIRDGEFISIIGGSGCGKSTLLRIIGGLETIYDGDLKLGGAPVLGPGLDRGVVFQEHRLLPWLTVWDNIAFGLANEESPTAIQLISEHIYLVGLTGFENAYPSQLSGGMAQRTAIARALVNRPKLLLLDEPFGSLDALTRIQLQKEILRIWQTERTTMILVTHDIDEAIYLGDRVLILSNRPGTVKKEVRIPLARPRQRGSADFVAIRETIYREFFSEEEALVDYMV